MPPRWNRVRHSRTVSTSDVEIGGDSSVGLTVGGEEHDQRSQHRLLRCRPSTYLRVEDVAIVGRDCDRAGCGSAGFVTHITRGHTSLTCLLRAARRTRRRCWVVHEDRARSVVCRPHRNRRKAHYASHSAVTPAPGGRTPLGSPSGFVVCSPT